MPVTIAVRFPLGRYHATPWDRSVNDGEVEWPPSPWRILRALLSTWHTRWPELPAEGVEALLERLSAPPTYLTPPVTRGHSRHYMPDADRTRGVSGNTDLALDPYIAIPRDAELLVRWDVALPPDLGDVLGKLVELLPYLGRADSVCEARLFSEDVQPDETWWRPVEEKLANGVRLLAPIIPAQRKLLEKRPWDMRKARRMVPQGARWVAYQGPIEGQRRRQPARTTAPRPNAVRFAVLGTAPFMQRYAVLAAEGARHAILRRLNADVPELSGKSGTGRLDHQHRHAHWIPLADDSSVIHSIVLWIPAGIGAEHLASAIRADELRLPGDQDRTGFRKSTIVLQAVGQVANVAPEISGTASTWQSVTPYLPVRHRDRGRESLDQHLTADVVRELAYRGLPVPASVVRVHPDDGMPDRMARDFRRYRCKESMAHRRPGLAVRIRFDRPVAGPIALGQLSHFGLGLFRPVGGGE